MKIFGFTLVAIGLLLISLFFLADAFGIGKDEGIGAAQILGILVAILMIVGGFGFISIGRNVKINLKNMKTNVLAWLLDLPTFGWVFIGFLIVFLTMFIFPMFLNPEHRIQYFTRYIPDHAPIGLDLNTIVGSIEAWLVSNQSPYPEFFYPPLHFILIAPITLLDYPQSYYLVTALTLASYIILSFAIPLLVGKDRKYSLSVFFFVTSLFSYGFQFELERGQFNVIAFTLCLFAIYIFYFQRSFRLLAYLLFSFSIHLRIYPAIFILLFVDDWSTLKDSLRRLFGLGILNLLLLFALGYFTLVEFLKALTTKMGPSWTWMGNHSITSFVYNLGSSGLGMFDQNAQLWLQEHSNIISITLLVYFGICLFAVVLKDFVNKAKGLNPDLLLVCTIGGLIIPSVSHDYKLALLAGPMAIAFANREGAAAGWKKLFSGLLVTLSSVAFSMTLFPYVYRPAYLENSFLLLLVILTSITFLSFLNKPKYLGDLSTEEPI